jgi:hypothetical protein
MEDKSGLRHLGENGYFEKFKRQLSDSGQTTSVGFSRFVPSSPPHLPYLRINPEPGKYK